MINLEWEDIKVHEKAYILYNYYFIYKNIKKILIMIMEKNDLSNIDRLISVK
jgi:hypothetical protein